ncbi:hypothetical protein pdam_00008624 [Pocillopora damicornis]|uniref:Uncharacterized protein n=1 Tax=Pocillopora damicornis TaxID=46731 RepID=A0A3M6U7S3_POCDA|nr:hypothetical protein pdam_00008624 [Pocillopora damicornis]
MFARSLETASLPLYLLSNELIVPALISVFPAPRPALVWQRKYATIHTEYNGRKMMSVILTVMTEL